jgi:hypothetical protein
MPVAVSIAKQPMNFSVIYSEWEPETLAGQENLTLMADSCSFSIQTVL